MARITVEDCLQNVSNRFELVMAASKRARQLEMDGADAKVAWDNDKPTVVALREIAEGYVDLNILEDYEPIDKRELRADYRQSHLAVADGDDGEAI